MRFPKLWRMALHWQVLIAMVAGVAIGLVIHLGDESLRESVVYPFDYAGALFLRLLKMLIVPLIFSSVVSGVVSVGRLTALRRLGIKTFAYYLSTSLLAICVGLVLVNLMQPGVGAKLEFADAGEAEAFAGDREVADILLRIVPENVFEALSGNTSILPVIFFAILLGVAITRVGDEHREALSRFFDALFAAMTRLAEFVIRLVPIGVLALMVRVVGQSGLEPFKALALFMLTVVIALVIHGLVVLPLVLRVFGRVSPIAWARAVWPALIMAFSTSSSSSTLPITMQSVQKRGGVSAGTSSFTLPLGATVNMDGTALYECIGVIFLAQYYAGAAGFELTLMGQVTVVVTALLASIGAAGIPSAGTVMMTLILTQLGLPTEGIPVLLVVDRPLDMLRTAVNVWSDTTCAVVIARSEGEQPGRVVP